MAVETAILDLRVRHFEPFICPITKFGSIAQWTPKPQARKRRQPSSEDVEGPPDPQDSPGTPTASLQPEDHLFWYPIGQSLRDGYPGKGALTPGVLENNDGVYDPTFRHPPSERNDHLRRAVVGVAQKLCEWDTSAKRTAFIDRDTRLWTRVKGDGLPPLLNHPTLDQVSTIVSMLPFPGSADIISASVSGGGTVYCGGSVPAVRPRGPCP